LNIGGKITISKVVSIYLTWAWIGTGSGQTDTRTDGRADRITTANTG